MCAFKLIIKNAIELYLKNSIKLQMKIYKIQFGLFSGLVL